MSQLKVFVISSNKEYRYTLKAVLETPDLAIVGYGENDPSSVQKARGLSPDVVVICYEGDAVFDIGERIYQSVPNCAIVLAAEGLSAALMGKAQSSGIALSVSLSDGAERLLSVVRRAGALASSRAGSSDDKQAGESRVVSVFSPKGGVGKTTIAVNIAMALAQMGKKAAIIDVSLDNASVMLFLDMQAKDTIAELSQERGMLSMESLRTYTVQHFSGLTVLAGPNSPEDGEFVQSRIIEATIAVMRPFFDAIILDLPTNFSEHTLVSIENSDRVIVPLEPDIASVKAAHTTVTILSSLRQAEKASFAFNKAAKKTFLTLKDVKKALGHEPEYVLPADPELACRCQCIGRPIVIEAPRSPLAVKLRAMAKDVMSK